MQVMRNFLLAVLEQRYPTLTMCHDRVSPPTYLYKYALKIHYLLSIAKVAQLTYWMRLLTILRSQW